MAVARRRAVPLTPVPARPAAPPSRPATPRQLAVGLIAAGTLAAALGYAAAIARREMLAAWGLTLAGGWLVAGWFALGMAGRRARLGPWWGVPILAGGCAAVPFAFALLRPGVASGGAPLATWGVMLGTGLLPALVLPLAYAVATGRPTGRPTGPVTDPVTDPAGDPASAAGS